MISLNVQQKTVSNLKRFGNQIIGNFIVLANPSRIKDFEKAYPSFKRAVCTDVYVDEETNLHWRKFILDEDCKDYVYHRAIIDHEIDEDLFKRIAYPYLGDCCFIEFF